MSAEEENPLHTEDNYDAAYSSEAAEAPVHPATPVHGYWRSLRELDGKSTLQTDRASYAAGDEVAIAGQGFAPLEE